MKKILITTIICFVTANAYAGELTTEATLAEIADNFSNSPDFTVRIESGQGICQGWIVFPESKATSLSSHNQALSIALTALATGKKVRIHNYEDNSCNGANFISIYK